jgi:hypothetical protein
VENFLVFIVIDDKGNDFFKEMNLGQSSFLCARQSQARLRSSPRKRESSLCDPAFLQDSGSPLSRGRADRYVPSVNVASGTAFLKHP